MAVADALGWSLLAFLPVVLVLILTYSDLSDFTRSTQGGGWTQGIGNAFKELILYGVCALVLIYAVTVAHGYQWDGLTVFASLALLYTLIAGVWDTGRALIRR